MLAPEAEHNESLLMTAEAAVAVTASAARAEREIAKPAVNELGVLAEWEVRRIALRQRELQKELARSSKTAAGPASSWGTGISC